MPEWPIDFHASCHKEKDGSLTVLVHVSGLPDVDAANMVSGWLHKMIQENAYKIGRRAPAPTSQ